MGNEFIEVVDSLKFKQVKFQPRKEIISDGTGFAFGDS